MNIFLTSPDPRVCAQALDDKRVNKMAVETAQLLATALRKTCPDLPFDGLYRATHTEHPCSKWARRSRANFLWLLEHGLELCAEYEFRTDRKRTHASKDQLYKCYALRGHIPDGVLAFDFNSSGFDTGNVFFDYQLCLTHKWRYLDGFVSKRSRKPVWTYRGAPPFKRELWGVNFNEIGQKK